MDSNANAASEANEWHSADAYPTREAYEAHQARLAAERLTDVPRAIREYTAALKDVRHYTRLYDAVIGGKNAGKRRSHASGCLRGAEARRDAALAVFHSQPDGVAWLEERERAKAAKQARANTHYTATIDRRIVDEYLYSSERMVIEHSAWRLEERFGHTAWAAEKRGEYERVKEAYEGLAATIQERDLWKAVTRRSQQLRKAGRQGRETPPPDAA